MAKLKATETEVKKFLGLIKDDSNQPSPVRESLPYLLSEHGSVVNSVFKTVVNHTDVAYEPSLLGFYTGTSLPVAQHVDTLYVSAKEFGIDPSDLPSLETSMFDFNGSPYVSVQNTELEGMPFVSQVIRLYLSDHPDKSKVLLGFVIPEDNSFLACDFTHTPEGANIFMGLLEFLTSYGLLSVIKKAKKKKAKKKKKAVIPMPTITFGADPEFEVLGEYGSVISLRNDGTPYSGIVAEGDNADAYTAPVGADHCGHQVEFRPEYALSPSGVVSNVRRLFHSVSTDARFSAIGDVYALGGHLHVGIGQIARPSAILLKLLDYFIGHPTLKMGGEARGGYNCSSAYETKPYGFEYRTPPAGVFAHPNMVYITYKILKVVLMRYLRQEEFVIGQELSKKELVTYANLTPNQADYYFEFIAYFREKCSYKTNIAAAWNKKAKRISRHKATGSRKPVTFRLAYGDDWEPRIQDKFSNAVMNIGIKTNNPEWLAGSVRVRLYGLGSDRGSTISGLSVTGFDTTGHPRSSSAKFYVGLPYELRMGEYSDEDVSSVINALTTHIVNTIQGRG